MHASSVIDTLGLSFDVFEEAWNAEGGPQPLEYRVMQRCLVVLGYPTGAEGRPCGDGEFGPNARRAIRQYQTENGLEPTGSLDAAQRRRLFDDAAAWMAGCEESVQRNVRAQLRRMEAAVPYTPRRMLLEYPHIADSRVEPALRPAFLALASWANNALTLPALPLATYVENLHSLPPREARRRSLRYGLLQLPASYFEAHPQFDPQRATNPGEFDLHFDTVAVVLNEDDQLRKAALAGDAEGMLRRLEWLGDPSVIRGPLPLPEALAEFEQLLAPKATTVS